MRIALIGLGDIAQKAYLPLLMSDERVTPLLCTRSPSVLGKLAASIGSPSASPSWVTCWQAARMR